MPLTLTLLSAAFPPERRTAALGLWSSIAGLGVALGPLLGGLIVEYARLALDLLDQRAGRADRGRARAPPPEREPRRAGAARPARPRARERRPARHRVGDDAGQCRSAGPRRSTLLAYAAGAVLLGAFVLQERRSAAADAAARALPPARLRGRQRRGLRRSTSRCSRPSSSSSSTSRRCTATRPSAPASRRCRGRSCRSSSRRSRARSAAASAAGRSSSSGLLLLSAGTAGAALAMGVGASYAELVVPLRGDRLRDRAGAPERRLGSTGVGAPRAHRQGLRRQQHVPPARRRLRHRRRRARVRPRRLLRGARGLVDGARAALFVAAAVAVLGAAGALGIPAHARARAVVRAGAPALAS